MLIDKNISEKKLLKTLGLPEGTPVYCDDPWTCISAKESGMFIDLSKDIYVFRYDDCNDYHIKVGYFMRTVSYGYNNQRPRRTFYFKSHNQYGPAFIIIFSDSSFDVRYFKHAKLSRMFEPAVISYNSKGCKLYEAYYLNGRLHNRAGPTTRYLQHGVWVNWFYQSGKRITLDRFCKNRGI